MLERLLLPFLLATCALVWTLWALVGLKKLSRGRRERRSSRRRARFRAALEGGRSYELRRLAREARRRAAARADLEVVLEELEAALPRATWDRLDRAVRSEGLERRVLADLRARGMVRRGLAALLAARLGLPGALEATAGLLGSRDPDARLAAVRAIALDRSAEAAWLLLDALAAGAVAPERIVERLGAPWALDALLEAYESPRLAPVRPRIVEALGLAGLARATDLLVASLRGGDEEERVQACRALGRMGGPEAAPSLVAALGDDFWPVRAQAAWALGRVGDERALLPLLRGLADSSWWVRANCAEALRALGAPGLSVLELARRHSDRYASDRAAEALALERAGRAAA